MNKELLDQIETIFIVENLYVTQNGITNSIIRKMKFMEDRWDYHPLLMTIDYNIGLNRIHNMLKYKDYTDDQTFLNKESRILSVYDYFQKSYGDDYEVVEYAREEAGMTYEELYDNVYLVKKEDTAVRIEHYTGFQKRLRLVQRFEGDLKKTKEIYYDDCGCLSMIRLFDAEIPDYYPLEYYYTTDRKCCIKAEYRYQKEADWDGKKNIVTKLSVFDDDGNLLKECADNSELAALCLEQITHDESKLYMIVAESGMHTKIPTLMKKKNVFKTCVVHNVFLEDADNLKSPPQIFFKHLCANYTHFDAIIFLTEWERKDFIRVFSDLRNTFVIPHPYPPDITRVPFEERDHRKAVIVSRFDPVKRINYAVDIFKLVVEKLPDVKLEIYGSGAEGENLNEQIKKLELENNVFIKNFTLDPAAVFRKALFSITTSSKDGYPLSLCESICNGCPVFAFDIKYGPSDIIRDGKTGYLIPSKDNAAFAEKIITYFQNESLQREFSKNAYDDTPRFSTETFLEKWYSMMETLYKRR